MVLQYQVSNAEMREAFHMNLNSGFWFKAAIGNLRALIIVIAVVVAAVAKITKGDTRNWAEIAGLFAVAVAILAFSWWRWTSSLKKAASKINASCNRMTIDAQGIATASDAGTSTFTPWTQFSKWKEGNLVYTVGDGKTFRTVPKSLLTDSQTAEVRGLLQSYVR